MAVLDRIEDSLRVRRRRHRRCLVVDAVPQTQVVAAHLFEQLDDLRGLLLAQDGQFQRELLAVSH